MKHDCYKITVTSSQDRVEVQVRRNVSDRPSIETLNDVIEIR